MILATNSGLTREKMLSMDKDELLDALEPFIEKARSISTAKAEEARRSLKSMPDNKARSRLEALCDYVVMRTK